MHPVPHAPLWHFILETLGVFLGFRWYLILRRRQGDTLPDTRRIQLLIAATLGALLGSRCLGALEDPALFWSGGGAAGWRYYATSKTIVGGLLGGLAATEFTKWFYGEHRRSGDLLVFPLLLAMITGRIGCFLMGIQEPTHGIITGCGWGMDLGDGQLRHPTALYEIAWLLLLGALLYGQRKRISATSGLSFMLFMSGYLLYRFLVGFIQPGVVSGGLLTLQWACLLGLGWYAWELWRLRPDTEGAGEEGKVKI